MYLDADVQAYLAALAARKGIALSDLANKISAEEMRHLNSEVDANQRDPAAVIRAFRASKSL